MTRATEIERRNRLARARVAEAIQECLYPPPGSAESQARAREAARASDRWRDVWEPPVDLFGDLV